MQSSDIVINTWKLYWPDYWKTGYCLVGQQSIKMKKWWFCKYNAIHSNFCLFQDGKLEPEVFTEKLQKELKSSPQPYLVPFLKVINYCFYYTLYVYCKFVSSHLFLLMLKQRLPEICHFLLKLWNNVKFKIFIFFW